MTWRAEERDERLDALLEAHGAALGRLAASYARTRAERDDLFQEIVVAIWKALPRFRGECSERTFIFRIAHNRGVAHIVKRTEAGVGTPAELELPCPALDPEQALSKAQEGRRLLDAVQRLPL